MSSAAPAQRPAQAQCLHVVPLRGWHLPLLQDPCFVDLLPLLQRAVLLQGPDRLLNSLTARPPLVPDVLLAYREPQHPLGLLLSQRLNRSGSCWQLLQLRSSEASLAAGEAGRMAIEAALIREAIQRSRGAASWIATAATTDSDRLALLRQQGFQPLRRETLWRWEPPSEPEQRALPSDLQLRPLNRRTAPAMWLLEQAALPAQLRQLLDRRVEDLLDQSEQPSLMLFDCTRQQAVAGARRLRPGNRGLPELELSVHPGWQHLQGGPLQLLLERSAAGADQLLVRSDVLDGERSSWLQSLGMAPEGEEVVMARSVWRRHAPQHSTQMAQRLESMLGRLQPGQRPIPTPLGRP
ncbi:hypothetical protein [Vulcanococcus sp.]|uniref:hypothetical protein n=1 Tax=Vulcanococcus sp. TaxID=2856995 RepID=UPI0025D6A7D3|nr:hypothetical protein [Vulcanococcus sp.]